DMICSSCGGCPVPRATSTNSDSMAFISRMSASMFSIRCSNSCAIIRFRFKVIVELHRRLHTVRVRHLRVNLRGLDVLMVEHLAYDVNIIALLDQASGVFMPPVVKLGLVLHPHAREPLFQL